VQVSDGPPLMEEQKYDSSPDTIKHIVRVQELMMACKDNLITRAVRHDASKLESPEKEILDEFTPKLRGLTYGSDEYRGCMDNMRVMIDHHYAKNSHHPESKPNGINGMSLLDLLEMLCDWKAAGERLADGSMERSLRVNRERFKISDQLYEVLENTVKELGL
jgi:hypothetical protein